MKDKSVFFNPVRMLSPKLDSEVIKIEELYQRPITGAMTLEEGLLVMISKLIEITRQARMSFSGVSLDNMEASQKLGEEVHQLEKLLLQELTCALSYPPEMCRIVIRFPGHLERVGDYLESILNCCRIRCRDAVPFTEKTISEIDDMFNLLLDIMKNFRDAFIRPNKVLLDNVISEGRRLDQLCQDLQLNHVESLLNGITAPRSSSLYLDIMESTQSINRHITTMATEILLLLETQEYAA